MIYSINIMLILITLIIHMLISRPTKSTENVKKKKLSLVDTRLANKSFIKYCSIILF